MIFHANPHQNSHYRILDQLEAAKSNFKISY